MLLSKVCVVFSIQGSLFFWLTQKMSQKDLCKHTLEFQLHKRFIVLLVESEEELRWHSAHTIRRENRVHNIFKKESSRAYLCVHVTPVPINFN